MHIDAVAIFFLHPSTHSNNTPLNFMSTVLMFLILLGGISEVFLLQRENINTYLSDNSKLNLSRDSY